MCPACIANTALVVASATSAGGVSALFAKLRWKSGGEKDSPEPKSKEK